MYPTWIRLDTKQQLLRRCLKYQDNGTLTKDICDNKRHDVDIVNIDGHVFISTTNISHIAMKLKTVQKHQPTALIMMIKRRRLIVVSAEKIGSQVINAKSIMLYIAKQ